MITDKEIITYNVIWNRLISVCEEQAIALMRAAFGAIVREAGDLSAGIFDANADMLAQAVTGTPGHVNTMAASVRNMLHYHSAESLQQGDVLVTNDPWLGAGHVFDFVVVTPVFVNQKIVAYLACTSHVVDVGGIGWSAEAKSVYEEGVVIPVTKLRRGDLINEDVLNIVAANSRIPQEAKGDILSLLSCNDTGVQRTLALMQEYQLNSFDHIAEFIFKRSASATRSALMTLPEQTLHSTMLLDGYDKPIELHATMVIRDGHIAVDLSGSSSAVAYGINCPLNYTAAYAAFGIRALLTPDIPNNQASLNAITVTAPAGLIVSAERPSPVSARHVVGQALPDLMLGCLAQVLPEKVLAESAGALWTLSLSGYGEKPFSSLNVALGGMGARPTCDGLSTTAFPSGVGSVPVEVAEMVAPVVYHHKEFAIDSGGAGQYRGGLGQRIEVGARHNEPLSVSAAAFERLQFGAAGRHGGRAGAAGMVEITQSAQRDQRDSSAQNTVLTENTDDPGQSNRTRVTDKGQYTIGTGERLILQTPGGGGYGDPKKRSTEAVARDVERGFVSSAKVNELYR